MSRVEPPCCSRGRRYRKYKEALVQEFWEGHLLPVGRADVDIRRSQETSAACACIFCTSRSSGIRPETSESRRLGEGREKTPLQRKSPPVPYRRAARSTKWSKHIKDSSRINQSTDQSASREELRAAT
ncbi:hypothetical protein EYF80_036024 [Liparis tanakae]|uniref:Uncharacterized protein n=1 Tax=Liparis tanakae TaxID=230148 RepID=A0A4Z2GJT3_9TELE|nr:hypothetical protein EYF80_036024 [Liparis tanakae]